MDFDLNCNLDLELRCEYFSMLVTNRDSLELVVHSLGSRASRLGHQDFELGVIGLNRAYCCSFRGRAHVP